MHKINSVLLVSIIAVSISCGRGDVHNPPEGAEIISFAENKYLKDQVIYQSDSVHIFKPGESLHRYWAGISKKPSHRLNVRLLSNSDDIMFTVLFPELNKKVYSKIMQSKDISGCEIPEQLLNEDEFIIEVLAPRGVVSKTQPEYRLFIGIQGYVPLEFYQRKKQGAAK